MADNNNPTNPNIKNITDTAGEHFKTTEEILRDILSRVESIDKTVLGIHDGSSSATAKNSQSTARDRYRDFRDNWRSFSTKRSAFIKSKFGRGGFTDALEDELVDSLLKSDLGKRIKSTLGEFADQLDTDIGGIPSALGKQIAKTTLGAFKQSSFGQKVFGELNTAAQSVGSFLKGKLQSGLSNLQNSSYQAKGADYIDRGVNYARDAFRKIKNKQFGSVVEDISSKGINAARGGVNTARSILSQFKDQGGLLGRGAKFGESILNKGVSVLKSGSGLGQKIFAEGGGIAQKGADIASKFAASGGPLGKVFGPLSKGLGAAAKGLGGLGAAGSSAGAVLGTLGAAAGGAIIAVIAFKKIMKSVGLAFEAFKIMLDATKKAANRNEESREKNIKLANERMKADVKTLVETPFKILEEAAQKWYDVWDHQLRTISATQGYTKAGVQDLMSAYTQRLKGEGLAKYISGAELTDNLAKVLSSGLSGKIAEEFAYQATKLNAAIPVQDFFDYASAYAAVAANEVKAGKSQTQAIQTATDSLVAFSSGLLYASRELSGGFTTGLKDATSLYEQAVKIALAGRSGNIAGISSVLLAIRGEVGAVAPDLATSLTDKIYELLTGGNASNIVALRSLAGINASNTEFLRAVTENPQRVFSTLFANLARMYSDSSDAYMEKAEGYASLFGLSPESFQRVNFADLANAISRMQMTQSSLDENMKLLREGQTTTTAEQLKNQQINQYMIDEGLSLVLDNEAARAIQQHMWDEQMARELMEATYAVELKGASAEALEKLKQAVNNILNFLNPFAWFKKLGNLVATSVEGAAQDADIRNLLQLGKVGSGNARSMYQLTTRNADLFAAPSLLSMMGGVSLYKAASMGTKMINTLGNGVISYIEGAEQLGNRLISHIGQSSGAYNMARTAITSLLFGGPSSKYRWGSVGKSTAKLAGALLSGAPAKVLPTVRVASGQSVASATAARAKASVDRMLADEYLVEQFVNKGKSYEDWAATASKFNISNLNQALESAGYSVSDVEQYFQDKETQQGMQAAEAIRQEEKKFRDTGISFWTDQFPNQFQTPLFSYMDTINSYLANIESNQVTWREVFKSEWLDKGWSAYVSVGSSSQGLFNKFYSEFMKYFVEHYYYSSTSGYKYNEVEEIQRKAKAQERGDTVYALAEMLTKNLLDLKDPTMQTNAILSQILIVVNAIMNQQNEVAGSTGQSQLLDSLSAMALGMTTKS